MSVFTAVHIHRPAIHRPSARSRNTGRAILGLLATVVRRIADSPLDSPVLRTLPGPASVTRATDKERSARPHAH
ncbi:hypothetical protein MOV08_32955 [Streptomyces yunnanensis]|uniref:Uncharacterized protein n=1 Tax=Streptomyces yunnanensis TaxID=156453 RepID=A0ABY8AF30_9ACTN|nr:hypothetical protein [Streptomyces yunnanensis]WEB43615.1 hypothetical protein MOV08_32955 [Streptomyces yunnanensis]